MSTTIPLSETQRAVLLKIGLSPGINAFAIASELERNQSAINQICKKLREAGFVTATEALNVKNARVLELRLTLIGFGFVVRQLYLELTRDHCSDITSDLGSTIVSLLQSNRDLHEGIDIFVEFFDFVAKKMHKGSMYWLFRSLASSLEGPVLRYEFVSTECSTDQPMPDWNYVCHVALSKDLFFTLWRYGEIYRLFTPEEKKFFETEIMRRFKDSEGWDLILDELEDREAECTRLKALKSLIQQEG
jgi:DNA-binding MarR family transcriptional regulator